MASSSVPTRKVGGGGVGGALAVVIVFIATQFGVEISAEVGAAFATLIFFITSYFIPEEEQAHEK